MPRRCVKKGHKWRQSAWGSVGTDRCARRGCTATRINPRALP
jgi:hypothetical protein